MATKQDYKPLPHTAQFPYRWLALKWVCRFEGYSDPDNIRDIIGVMNALEDDNLNPLIWPWEEVKEFLAEVMWMQPETPATEKFFNLFFETINPISYEHQVSAGV